MVVESNGNPFRWEQLVLSRRREGKEPPHHRNAKFRGDLTSWIIGIGPDRDWIERVHMQCLYVGRQMDG